MSSRIDVVVADITKLKVDAIVNAGAIGTLLLEDVTNTNGQTLLNRGTIHTCTVRKGPTVGVYAVQMLSARAFDKHWHDTFGFGMMDEGR